MASEIRVDKINSLSGVGTVTLSPTGVDIAGITTAATLRATTGIVTSLTAVSSAKVGSGVTLSPDGDIFATGGTTSTTFVGNLTGNVTGNVSGSSGSATGNAGGLTGTPNISVGTIAGSTGTFTGDVDIADKIVHTGDTDTALRFPAINTFTVETAGSERIRIDSDGRVMIGQTSSVVPFMITGTASSYGGENTVGVFGDGTSYASGVGGGITLSGKYNSGGSQVGYAAIRGRKENGTDGNYNGALTFATRPNGGNMTERARITSGGSLLIGHTSSEHSDGYQIELSDTSSDSSIALTSIQDNIYASQLSFVKARGSSLGARTIVQDGDILGQFAFYGADGTNRALGCTINVRVDGTPGDNDMPTRIDFAVSNDGTQSVQNRLRLRASGDVQIPVGNIVMQTAGKGIDFSATGNGSGSMTNELLDDYEEGTWSPGIDKNASSMTGVSYTYNSGTYTKIGRLVMVWFDLTVSSVSGSGSGVAYIAGLPYVATTGSNTNGGYGAPTFRDSDLVESDFRVYGSSSHISSAAIYLYKYNSAGNQAAASIGSSGRITGQAFYFTTA